jgi:hypothetical protein
MVAADPTQPIAAMSASAAQSMAASLPQTNMNVDQDESWRRRGRDTD